MFNVGASGDYSSGKSNDGSDSGKDSLSDYEEEVGGKKYVEKCWSKSSQTDINKTFHFLDCSRPIYFIDTDEDFIITASHDYEIRVWNVKTEECIQKIAGHEGDITGLKFQDLSSESENRTIISASEDGTIRQWSIPHGKELKILTTADVITCMGVMNNSLAVTGNNRGYLEVYHLLTGELYSRVLAHVDPIDALMVSGIYICTVVYDKPCHLRVWQLKWGKLICLYDLEDMHRMEFRAFTLHAEELILGDEENQRLHFLHFPEENKYSLSLRETPGTVQHVNVMKNLVLSSTKDTNQKVYLHVHEQRSLEHLLTFHCENINSISAIIVIRDSTTLKFLLGGSALAIYKLKFTEREYNMEDLTNRHFEIERKIDSEDDGKAKDISFPKSSEIQTTHKLYNKLGSTLESKLPEDEVSVEFSKYNSSPKIINRELFQANASSSNEDIHHSEALFSMGRRIKLPPLQYLPKKLESENSEYDNLTEEKCLNVSDYPRDFEEFLLVKRDKRREYSEAEKAHQRQFPILPSIQIGKDEVSENQPLKSSSKMEDQEIIDQELSKSVDKQANSEKGKCSMGDRELPIKDIKIQEGISQENTLNETGHTTGHNPQIITQAPSEKEGNNLENVNKISRDKQSDGSRRKKWYKIAKRKKQLDATPEKTEKQKADKNCNIM